MSRQIMVGGVAVGGGAPVSIQSMCNTVTENVEATAQQILRLEQAGCEIIRVAVPTEEAARAIPAIKARIRRLIAEEDARKPLSDNTIADLLGEEGIQVARRTVAKYREALLIPPASQRKMI